MYVLEATLLNVSLAVFTRIAQCTSPLRINTSAINEYNEKIHNFYYLRLAFGILVLSNSVLIAEDWTIRGVALYAVYFIPVVAWFEIFYASRFKTAFVIGLFSACFAMVNALVFKPHPFLWVYAILFSSFITYISAYFEYCVVKN